MFQPVDLPSIQYATYRIRGTAKKVSRGPQLVSARCVGRLKHKHMSGTYEPDPDAQLMLRVQRGDMEAFEMLVERYKKPVINLIYRTLRDLTEAEDLAQNVFVQVFKSAHRYKATGKFSTWLFTIARNLSLNEIRRRTRHPAFSLDAPAPDYEDLPSRQFEDLKSKVPTDSALQSELVEKIDEALASLPESQRTAIVLFRQDELSYEEISEVIGCSLSATKSLIHRGRETLRRKLKAYLRTGEWEDEPAPRETSWS